MKHNGQTQREEADSLFCARIADMVRQLDRTCTPCFTRFLDSREQRLALLELQRAHLPEDQFLFWTGFCVPDNVPARRMLGLFPDYLAPAQGMDRSLQEEQFPIERIALSYREEDELTHRDILGALMGLNLKRELIGEILTGKDYAVLFCTGAAGQVILSELERVGRAGVKKQAGYEGELPEAYRLHYQTGTVSSLRLDCVVSLATNLSREKSAALIESGQVSLNFFEEEKISREVKESDILSIRGFGRYELSKIGSLSKKGRLHLTIGKYI